MDHVSKFTLALLARNSRQQLLNNKEYVTNKWGFAYTLWFYSANAAAIALFTIVLISI
jgi:hypothetical protein